MAVEESAAQKQLEEGSSVGARRRLFRLRYLGPKAGLALVLWRGGAYAAAPLGPARVAPLGRWAGARGRGPGMGWCWPLAWKQALWRQWLEFLGHRNTAPVSL